MGSAKTSDSCCGGAERDRARARLNEVACSRREIRSYRCAECHGWHLTSQPDRPIQLVPVINLTAPLPRTTTRPIRRTARALTAGAAA